MNKKAGIVIIIIVGIVACCLLLTLSGRGNQSPYDTCVKRCLDATREANIDRDDITDADYKIIMAEHENYICPGKCEQYK